MADYYGIARRQGASNYVATRFEAYAHAALDRGARPIPCNRWLAIVDWQGIDAASSVTR